MLPYPNRMPNTIFSIKKVQDEQALETIGFFSSIIQLFKTIRLITYEL